MGNLFGEKKAISKNKVLIMDGIAMIDKLRADKLGKNTSIIVLSNSNDMEKESDFVKKSVYNYLIKTDWKIEDIIMKIKKTLKA